MIPTQKGEKLEMLIWRVVPRYWRKLEDFIFGKTKQNNWQNVQDGTGKDTLEFSTETNKNILCTVTLISVKDNQSKTNLFAK